VKALIKVGYACNDHCTFCHTLDVRPINDTAENIQAKIVRAKQLGHSMVVFSGGEPTIRPETVAWASQVASLGLELGFVTNGRLFAYPDFVESMLERNLKYVYLSLHGGKAKVHNSLVRAQAFEESFQGVKNLHGRIPVLTVNCVVTTANIKHLKGVVDLLLPFPELTIKFSMTAPKGGANTAFDVVVPSVVACAKAVEEAISYGLAQRGTASGPAFAHDGLPFCLLPGLEHLYDDLRTNDFRTMIEVGEPDFYPVDDIIKVQPDPCQDCSMRGPCPGLFRGYLDNYPDDVSKLTPHVGPRPNSYNLVPLRDIKRPKASACPLKTGGTTSYDRARDVFVRLVDRMRLFETGTRDFADVELLHIKEDLGQVYLDISNKIAPDDFAKDLRKLKLSTECTTCERRPECTGCWVPIKQDLFTRDDEQVHQILRELRGTVLDIGAGEGSYLTTLRSQAEQGNITYLALEPDETRARLLGSKYPWAQVVCAPAEEGDWVDESLDHVLILRSYNHLRQPAAVLERVVRALRVGGTLTVVDNVAFALLRSRIHAQKAEHSHAMFEHYRNAEASHAVQLCQPLPLRLVQRRDVTQETSNQWLLRYQKISLPTS
jgi:uncharacterized Fe-S cluster-containing radical SAM superfamily protein